MGIVELYRKESKNIAKKAKKMNKRINVVKSVYKNRKRLGAVVYGALYLLLSKKD